MLKQISILEFEDNIFQLALHGVDKSRLEKLKDDFYSGLDSEHKSKARKISIDEFRIMGLSVGRENKTVVKR